MRRYVVIVRSKGILAVAHFDLPYQDLGKAYDVGHEGPGYEAACTEIAEHIAELKATGVDSFHFAKTEDIDLATLYKVATRIAEQVPGTRSATSRVLN